MVRAVDVRSPAQGPNARYRDALRMTRILRAARPGEGGGCHVPQPVWQIKAHGNEPFWAVMVYPDSLVLKRPEGSGVVFEGAAPSAKDKAQLWSTATADKVHRMSLQLEDVGCVDGMSGESQPQGNRHRGWRGSGAAPKRRFLRLKPCRRRS